MGAKEDFCRSEHTMVQRSSVICGARGTLSLRCDAFCLIGSMKRLWRGLTSSISWALFLTALLCLYAYRAILASTVGDVWNMLPRVKWCHSTPSDKLNELQILVLTTTDVIEGKNPTY